MYNQILKSLKLGLVSSLVAAMLAGCAPKFSRNSGAKNGAVSNSVASTLLGFLVKREANSDGSNPNVLTSSGNTFNVSKTSIGGNFQKSRGTSASYIVTGGFSAGL